MGKSSLYTLVTVISSVSLSKKIYWRILFFGKNAVIVHFYKCTICGTFLKVDNTCTLIEKWYSLIHVFRKWSLNNKINRLYRCGRVIYIDKHSNVQRLLGQDRSVSVHTHNLQTHAINPLTPGGNKKVTPESFRFVHACVTFLLPPESKGLTYIMYLKKLWQRFSEIFSILDFLQFIVYVIS